MDKSGKTSFREESGVKMERKRLMIGEKERCNIRSKVLRRGQDGISLK